MVRYLMWHQLLYTYMYTCIMTAKTSSKLQLYCMYVLYNAITHRGVGSCAHCLMSLHHWLQMYQANSCPVRYQDLGWCSGSLPQVWWQWGSLCLHLLSSGAYLLLACSGTRLEQLAYQGLSPEPTVLERVSRALSWCCTMP